MPARVFSHFSRVRLFVTLWTVARQASPSVGLSRQEYWSGSPCLPPGDLPYPGIVPTPPASSASQADSLWLSHWGSARYPDMWHYYLRSLDSSLVDAGWGSKSTQGTLRRYHCHTYLHSAAPIQKAWWFFFGKYTQSPLEVLVITTPTTSSLINELHFVLRVYRGHFINCTFHTD